VPVKNIMDSMPKVGVHLPVTQ